jgi:hypothetical protein
MSSRKVHIENLKIRLPRSAAASARAIAGGLGADILRGVADATRDKTGTKRIDELSTGKITASDGAGGQNLSKQISRRVAAELARRFE